MMDRKEKRYLASQIAKLERKIKKATTEAEKEEYEQQIQELSKSITSLDDMIALDDYIQKKYKNLLDF